ncbi:MAG: aldo/keto reductase [Roseiflexaceae bacterium]|nr:aldo/keto reductase [Roseiflexaceae bacterium]
MSLPEHAYRSIAPNLRICCTLTGMWQVSGGHGPIDPTKAVDAMIAYHDAGFTTWDLADHYGPAEDFIGAFRRRLAATRGQAALESTCAFTKWVPQPGPMTRPVVERAVDISLRRMDVSALDMLQFHWWDYQDQRYLDAFEALAALQQAGKLRHLGLTNFDTAHLAELVGRGLPIVTNQVQYSLIDRRPEVQMAAFCQTHQVGLLAYGTLCGGLLGDKYLGQPEPTRTELRTASLQKYKRMIDLWGGWALFQELLAVLRQLADRHQSSIATIALRAILDRPAVAGVIVGARLGVAEHRDATAAVFALALDERDHQDIDAVLARSNDLFQRIGDCGDEYRR